MKICVFHRSQRTSTISAKISRWRMNLGVLCWIIFAVGCGSQPATIAKQAHSLSEHLESQEDAAELGWLYYLAGDSRAALTAFERSKDQPISQLGLARLAADRLDDAAVSDALRNVPPEGQVGRIATRWRRRIQETAPRAHWSYHGPMPFQNLRRSLNTLNPASLTVEENRLLLGSKEVSLTRSQPEGGSIFVSVAEFRDHPFIEVSHEGAFGIWQMERWLHRVYDSTGQIHQIKIDPTRPVLVFWSGKTPPHIQPYSTAGKHLDLNRLGPAVTGHDRSTNWVRRYLEVWDLIQRRQGDQAMVALSSAPNTPAFSQLRARAQQFRPMSPNLSRWI